MINGLLVAGIGMAVVLSFALAVGVSAFLGARMRWNCPRCQAKSLRMEGGTKGIDSVTYYRCERCDARLKNSRNEWSDVDDEEWGRSA